MNQKNLRSNFKTDVKLSLRFATYKSEKILFQLPKIPLPRIFKNRALR
jgi:hypothetical protein